MGTISNLSVSLTANTRGLQKGLNKARRHVRNFSKSVLSMKGAVLGAFGVAGIGAALSSVTNAFREQEQAVASLEAANKSMGRSTVGITDDMIKLAAQIQREGIIGDEAIIKGQSFLSTFAQIPDSLLPRATRAMVDLMAKTGQSGQAAANMIGKASMGLTGSLRIAGITVSDTTEKFAKNLTSMKKSADDAGLSIDFLGAESRLFKMILADIESQIGGTNAALAKTDTGALDQLSNSAGDLREKLGQIVASGIAPFARQLSADIDNADINVKDLSMSFRQFLMDSAEGIGGLIQKFNGIVLVLKNIKLGFLGFGAFVTHVFATITKQMDSLFSLFGSDVFSGASSFFEDSLMSQIDGIRVLKAEISSLADDLSNRRTAGAFENTLSGFFDRAQATQQALDKPEVIAPEFRAPGAFDKLLLRQVSPQNVTIDKAPQIDRTNQLLQIIVNKPTVAVAG